MSKVKNIKRKQLTLAAFEFKNTIVHRGVEAEVKLPTDGIEVLYPCNNCERKFNSSQGLSFHVKTMHQNMISNSVSSSPKKEQTGYDELMSLQVKDVVDTLIDRVVSNIAKSTGENKIAGKSDISTQLALKHQQLMNMKMELVKRKLPKNFVSLKVRSQDG